MACTSATLASGTGTVAPWMMSNRSIGEPSNVGLLVRTTGFVSYVDPSGTFAYIDDDSGLRDGNTAGPLGAEIAGVRVVLPSSLTMKTTQYVTVTGISSLVTVAGGPAKAILAQAVLRDDGANLIPDMSMLCVPGGGFLMGNSGAGDDALDGYSREYPQHAVSVPTFWISKYEVTRAQYNSFISAGGYSNASYWSTESWFWRASLNRTRPDFWATTQYWEEFNRAELAVPAFTQAGSDPVVGVSYYEAEAFCKWAGGRLPTEAEWEKAARWDGMPRVYPWGSAVGTSKCNDWFDTVVPGFQTAVVTYGAADASPYGCAGMGGNVWEWTQDWYESYPDSDTPFDATGTARSVRGGGWYGAYGVRCASRWFAALGLTDNDVGFRLAH